LFNKISSVRLEALLFAPPLQTVAPPVRILTTVLSEVRLALKK